MPVTITRKLEWDSGHRVLGHEGHCKHLHGHHYSAKVTVVADKLDSLGRVIDFGVVKNILKNWLDTNWDHNILLNSDDPLYHIWLEEGEKYSARLVEDIFAGKKPYGMGMAINPTAEMIAHTLYNVATELLTPYDIRIVKVRIYETTNCYADYSEG